MKTFMSNLQATRIAAWMICQIKNRSPYMYDFSFCNHDSHHDLPNSDIPPLHFLGGMVQESNMCTSHQNMVTHTRVSEEWPSPEHIAKKLEKAYRKFTTTYSVPVSVLQGLELPPVAIFVHNYSHKILQCCMKATFQQNHTVNHPRPLKSLEI